MGRLSATWNEIGTTLPERVGTLAAVGLSGLTFGRSLMPRSALGQVAATGMWGAVSYGIVTAAESVVIGAGDAVAERLDDRPGPGSVSPELFGLTLHLGAAAVGFGIERAVSHRPGESVVRAGVRTCGTFLKETAVAGAVALSVIDLVGQVAGRNVRDDDRGTYRRRPGGRRGPGQGSSQLRAQTVIPGAPPRRHRPAAVTKGIAESAPWYAQMGALMAVGGGAAAASIYWQRRQARNADQVAADVAPGRDEPEWLGSDVVASRQDESHGYSAVLAAGAGAGVAVSIVALGKVHGLLARAAAATCRPMCGKMPAVPTIVGQATASGVFLAALAYGTNRLLRSVDERGVVVEGAYRYPPTSRTCSGGPNSLVDWATLGREGRRFVNMALEADEITAVTGQPAIDPIRAFIGLGSASTPLERAELLVHELERLGAFDRSIICLASPTGMGYTNPTMAETFEYLTAGDCAIAAVQYSVRPSFLSLNRVAVGRANNVAALTLLQQRLEQIPAERRPRLVGFGESLGAHTLQDVALHRGAHGLRAAGLERALFIGSPSSSEWVDEWESNPELVDPGHEVVKVANIGEWWALDDEERASARYVLLSHHEDPVVRFGPRVALMRPKWLDPSRPNPPGVPPEMRWHPLVTFFIGVADIVNAQNVVPGVFAGFGHDYRADTAELTRVAFNLTADAQTMAAVEQALRSREALWAARRLVAQQIDKMRRKISGQLGGLSLSSPLKEYVDRLSSLSSNDPVLSSVIRVED